jgi:GNAT superfamily N-acetyltransferase
MDGEAPITIRDVAPDERAAMQAMTIAAYEQYAEAMAAEWWGRYRQVLLDALTATEPVERIVAAREGEIIGGVLLYPPSPEAERELPMIRLLAVAPSARGQGAGRMLMDECLRRARRSGAPAITLHTTEIMAVARRMYEGIGFVRAPELDFRPGPDLLVMGYRLALGRNGI